MNNVVSLKQSDKLELILLPPKEPEQVTQEDVKYFFKNLINIFLEEE